ncbi:MAG: DUF308 domain-containing protein [Ruminococcaceae bacterium]|nr:DUF308 domain-containing protein [Oscillospiraceae bacterium]
MKNFIKYIKSSYMLTAILYALLGILMLIWPEIITRIVCYGFGSLLMIYGLIQIIANFSNKAKTKFSGINTVNGLISSGIGIFFIVKYQILTDSIGFVMGLVIIIDSFIKFQKSLELQKHNYSLWWVGLLLTFLTIALGVLVFINPFGTQGIARFVGACLVVMGCTDVWLISRYVKITACQETDGEILITDKENKA